MITISEAILAAIFTLYPHIPHNPRVCMEHMSPAIVESAEAANQETKVPPAILLVAAFLETHIGCDHGEGGGWGAPVSRSRRHTAGTPLHAARSLQHGMEACHNWQGGVSFFRCGRCRCPQLGYRINRHGRRERIGGYRAEDALAIVERLHAEAGIPLPEHFRH